MKKFGTCHSIFKGDQGFELMKIETDISSGIFLFRIIGLADRMVQESKFRVSSSLRNAGFGVPQRRNEKVTISLLPAHIKKISIHCDLAIAAAYLIASEQITKLSYPILFIGQLGLDGKLICEEDISHIFSIGTDQNILHFVIPKGSTKYINPNSTIFVAEIEQLSDLEKLSFKKYIASNKENELPVKDKSNLGKENSDQKDKHYIIDDLHNIDHHKRALMIALAGRHPILLSGDSGSGKSSLARCAPELYAKLSQKESLEVQSIYSYSNISRPLFNERPVRTPHHGITRTGLIGGVHSKHAGEIALSHHGFLILDEFYEFDRESAESLREVFDMHGVHIRRNEKHIFIPFEGLVIATTNICPCGSSSKSGGDMRTSTSTESNNSACVCSNRQLRHYRSRISNALLDRFHIRTMFGPKRNSPFDRSRKNSSSQDSNTKTNSLAGIIIKKNIDAAINIQKLRNSKLQSVAHVPEKYIPNSKLSMTEIMKSGVSEDAKDILSQAEEHLHISKRRIINILRVARTIADLSRATDTETNNLEIQKEHILEAIQYSKGD